MSYLVHVYEKLFRSTSTKHWWLCIVVAANVCKISVRLAASRPPFLCRSAACQLYFYLGGRRPRSQTVLNFFFASGWRSPWVKLHEIGGQAAEKRWAACSCSRMLFACDWLPHKHFYGLTVVLFITSKNCITVS